jgi:hypothetical protein
MQQQPEAQHYHHPPYAWLGAAVLFWGMVAFWLMPTVWTWVRTVGQKPVSQSSWTMTLDPANFAKHAITAVPRSDNDWILWEHIPGQRKGGWSWVHGFFADERACEDVRALFKVQEQAGGFEIVAPINILNRLNVPLQEQASGGAALATMRLVCLPSHIDPHVWTGPPNTKEPQP